MMKNLLERLLEEKAPGPYPSFSVVHIIKALELMAVKGPIGRGKLSGELKIGEGATRTLINRLKNAELITASKPGCSLTKKGREIWSELHAVFPRKTALKKSKLTVAAYNVAMLVKGHGQKVGSGMAQRDAAMMVGAKGATTLVFKNRKLVLPGVSGDIAADFPAAYNQMAELKPEENDAVVIGSADTPRKAEEGALAATWALIDN